MFAVLLSAVVVTLGVHSSYDFTCNDNHQRFETTDAETVEHITHGGREETAFKLRCFW
jgi:hypothetical protein